MPVGLNMEGHVTVRDSEAQLNLAAIRARHQSALCCPCCGPEHATADACRLCCRTSADPPCVSQGARRSRLYRAELLRPFANMQARADLDTVQHMRPKPAT